MDASVFQKLGLTVIQDDGEAGVTVEFEPASALLNPISRELYEAVTFTVLGDRLVALEPAALVGTPAVALSHVNRAADIEEHLATSLNEVMALTQRRSSELQALGISSKVDPQTLVLSASFEAPPFSFEVVSDKRGNVRVRSAKKDGANFELPQEMPFDLSEFRDRNSFNGFLSALVGEDLETPTEVEIDDENDLITFGVLAQKFGGAALLPVSSSLEILVELSVKDQPLRFAAARVSGNTFRGLLAGPKGKLWAERFQLSTFPGVVALVSSVMKVSPADVTVLSAGRNDAS